MESELTHGLIAAINQMVLVGEMILVTSLMGLGLFGLMVALWELLRLRGR